MLHFIGQGRNGKCRQVPLGRHCCLKNSGGGARGYHDCKERLSDFNCQHRREGGLLQLFCSQDIGWGLCNCIRDLTLGSQTWCGLVSLPSLSGRGCPGNHLHCTPLTFPSSKTALGKLSFHTAPPKPRMPGISLFFHK